MHDMFQIKPLVRKKVEWNFQALIIIYFGASKKVNVSSTVGKGTT